MYVDIEQTCWMDGHFNTYTTLNVCGWYYTFEGELEVDRMNELMSVIVDSFENPVEDGATLEMDDNVVKVMYTNVHQTNLIIN